LGRPILGTKNTVKTLDRGKVLDFYRQFYTPDNFIISAAGNLQHDRVVELVHQKFGLLPPALNGLVDIPHHTHSRITLRSKKDLEQVQICLGVPSYPLTDERRYCCYILNTLLGGGMSSRLFQNVREKQGLVYAIFSGINAYRDTGCLAIYAGTSLETAGKVVDLIIQEFHQLKEVSVKPDELRRAKDYLKGSMMLSLESTSSRMSHLARQEQNYGKQFSMDEMVQNIEKVTSDELQLMAGQIFDTRRVALTILGNLEGFKITRDRLDCDGAARMTN
jgi:predicted Zn-dependent peptidase